MHKRPLGLVLICIFAFLNSLILVIKSAVSLFLSVVAIPCTGERYWSLECMYESYGRFLKLTYAITGVAGIVIGTAGLVVIYWLWSMKKRGLKYANILYSLALVSSLLQSNYLGILLSIVILVYLVWKKDIFRY